MTVSADERYEAENVLRRWLDFTGVPRMDLAEADQVEGGWKRYARCGQEHPGAPDPELFYPISADQPETYVAQTLCGQCPVRMWCDKEGTAKKAPGIWGGIFRDDKGRAAPLCRTAGCRRYRKHGRNECGQCIQAADRTRKRQERVNTERKEARRLAREATAPVSPALAGMELAEPVAAGVLEVVGA